MKRCTACALLLAAAAVAPAAGQLIGFPGIRPLPPQPILAGAESVLPDAEWSPLGYVIVVRVNVTPRSRDASQMPESLLFVPQAQRCSFGAITRSDFSRLIRSPDLGDRAQPFVSGYQSVSTVGVARLPAGRYPDLRLEYALRARSRNTIVNEPRALEVPWPDGPWSNELARLLEPEPFVESDAPEIRSLVERWTNGEPKRARPYHLAKHLAGRVLEHMTEVTGENLRPDGLVVAGALAAARSGRGNGLDLASLLCAVYRAAGIPARLVVCADAPRGVLTTTVSARAVVEFFLPPERDWESPAPGESIGEADGLWIPVDIQSQREFSSRPMRFEQPWPYFGSSDRLETLVPLAFHFQPPVESSRPGPPALWSWAPGPASDDWRQTFSLMHNEAAIQPTPEELRTLPGTRPGRISVP